MSQKLRILAVGDAKSVHVQRRVGAFRERGHHILLLTEAKSGLDAIPEIEVKSLALDRGTRVRARVYVERGLRRSLGRGLGPIGAWADLRTFVDKFEPDLIHVHYAYGGAAWLAAALDRHPLIVSVMGGDILFDEQGSPTAMGRWLTRRLLDRADLITAKSAHLIRVLERLGDYGSKTIRILWGVESERFRRRDARALRVRLGVEDDARLLLSPRALRRFYRIDRIIDAMPAILTLEPKACLLVTGSSPEDGYELELRQRVASLGLERRVLFVGKIAAEAMPDWYSIAEVAISVPPSDGIPQTLLEAMACKTPSVIADLERYREVATDRETAMFVDATPSAIAKAVLELLSDHTLHQKIAENGRRFVEIHGDFENEVSRLEEKLFELVRCSSRRSSPIHQVGTLAGLCLFRKPSRARR